MYRSEYPQSVHTTVSSIAFGGALAITSSLELARVGTPNWRAAVAKAYERDLVDLLWSVIEDVPTPV